MKSATLSAVFSAAVFSALLLFTSSALAQLIAYDDAGDYVVTANWTNGANQGFGFTPWAIITNGPDFHSTYINSANNPTFVIASVTNVLGTNYTDVWGMFANGPTDVNKTTAYRGFANSLGTNTFKLQWGSRGAGSTATTNSGTVHGWCGFSLRTGNSTNSAYDINAPDGTARLFVYFLDGQSPSTIYFLDGNGPQSVPNTSFSDLGRNNITNAIEAEITPGPDGSSYHMILKDCVQNRTIFTTNSIFVSPGTIDSTALFAYETTGDQVYNRMQIASPTNIPPTLANVLPASGSLYLVAGSTSISFEVDSFNSTVVSNAVSLYINGVQQPGASLTFNTASPTAQLLVTNTTPLAPDTLYNFTIIAADANDNVVSNNFNFNTFLTNDIYIDAYDYNYNQGQFINSNTPVNAYQNLLGTNFVDYQISDLTGTNNTAGYRPGDLPAILPLATDTTGDPVDHANLRANGHTAYNIGFTDTGNWENYTRVFPATNYNLYARAASTSGGQFELEKLTNAIATTTNQPLVALGRFNFPATGGSKVFTGPLTPLTDFFGNPVVMPLSGTNTLRETSLASRIYNIEYFLAVAASNATTLRPYIATGSPVPNATGVNLNSAITFAVANRQTSVTNIQLFVNTTNVTAKLVLSSNMAGIVVTYTPTNNLPANFTNTVAAVISDNTGVNVTNTWTFITGTSGGVLGNGVWSGGGGSNDMFWADGINWTGGTPGPGFAATFSQPASTATFVTNNIVATNVTITQLNYSTNTSGYHTTWIQDGVTLMVTNGATSITAALQVGIDAAFNTPNTNTITGTGGTLLVLGNAQNSGPGLNNSLNFQVRQCANPPRANQVTLDMSGLGTMIATVGKFYVAQGGANSSGGQTNVTGFVLLARTNIITCLRAGNAGQFEVGDSSGGSNTLMGSTLYLGITNSLYVDTARFGKQKATNNLVRFNPAFTNITTPAVLIRGTNGPNSRVSNWTVADADTETVGVPVFVQANVDFSGGTVNGLLNQMLVGDGANSTTDSGFSQGTFSMTAGLLDVTTLKVAIQRANNTATETGAVNINGSATLASTNIILAPTAAGGNASLVNGSLNVTNGTVRGNIFAGGGVSTVNLNGGTLVVSNFVGTSAARLSALNLANASLHLKVDGNAPAANVNVTNVSATGTTTITIDSVANVSGPTNIHLISYTGTDPTLSGFALSVLPAGYVGNLVDNSGSIDLSINVAPSVPPTIRSIVISGGQIIISGTNNVGSGGTYHVLTSTNMALSLTNWTVLTNGTFDVNGNFSSTNVTGNNAQQFYILKLP